jgi:hypothetical protein
VIGDFGVIVERQQGLFKLADSLLSLFPAFGESAWVAAWYYCFGVSIELEPDKEVGGSENIRCNLFEAIRSGYNNVNRKQIGIKTGFSSRVANRGLSATFNFSPLSEPTSMILQTQGFVKKRSYVFIT